MLPLVPEQVAMVVSELVNVTGLPELPPVADKTNDPSPKAFGGIALKVMTCAALVTSSALTTSCAA